MNIIEKLTYQEMLLFLETPFNKYELTVMLIIGGLFLFFFYCVTHFILC